MEHVEKAIIQSAEVNNTSQKMATTFRTIVLQLQQLLAQQNSFVDEMVRKQYMGQKQDHNAENTYTMDVELF